MHPYGHIHLSLYMCIDTYMHMDICIYYRHISTHNYDCIDKYFYVVHLHISVNISLAPPDMHVYISMDVLHICHFYQYNHNKTRKNSKTQIDKHHPIMHFNSKQDSTNVDVSTKDDLPISHLMNQLIYSIVSVCKLE